MAPKKQSSMDLMENQVVYALARLADDNGVVQPGMIHRVAQQLGVSYPVVHRIYTDPVCRNKLEREMQNIRFLDLKVQGKIDEIIEKGVERLAEVVVDETTSPRDINQIVSGMMDRRESFAKVGKRDTSTEPTTIGASGIAELNRLGMLAKAKVTATRETLTVDLAGDEEDKPETDDSRLLELTPSE